ncbi:DoxX family protein [Ideonella sp. DXS22W]|uniref:DoxX family protein n=1 Tax=Pseudaquabacterium inlustre TaxID=2984192 RepID=A0ABU9CBR1_9BURK
MVTQVSSQAAARPAGWRQAALRLHGLVQRAAAGPQALAQLAARWHVAQVFFLSGLTKLRDWDTTLALFQDEYHVPLLPPGVAAVMGTGGELVLPVLLLLGLGGRFAALGLSVVNVVAVLSLPDMPEPALNLHLFWGSLLLGVLLWGPGRLSVDAWAWRRWMGEPPR